MNYFPLDKKKKIFFSYRQQESESLSGLETETFASQVKPGEIFSIYPQKKKMKISENF